MVSYLFTALNAVTATGPGSNLAFNSPRALTINAQIVFSGTITSGSFAVESSLDGVNWHNNGNIGFDNTVPSGFMWNTGSLASTYVRANLTALVASAGATVTLTWAVSETDD